MLWRIVLQALLMIGLGALPILLIAEPLTALHRRGLFLPGYTHEPYDRVINVIIGPLLTAAVIASVMLAARWLDHRPMRDFGVLLDRAWWRNLALGFGLGALLMLFVFVTEWAAGWIEITGTSIVNIAGVSLALSLTFSLVKVVCVGIYEEFVARGYQLRNLIDGINVPAGVAISSAIFALLHLTNDNASAMSSIGLFINGILFAVAVLATGRLSTSIGLHIAWNLFQGAILGFPVSGDKEGASLIGIRQLGPDLVTGGAFGPEAGLIGVAASLIGIVVIASLNRRHLRLLDHRV